MPFVNFGERIRVNFAPPQSASIPPRTGGPNSTVQMFACKTFRLNSANAESSSSANGHARLCAAAARFRASREGAPVPNLLNSWPTGRSVVHTTALCFFLRLIEDSVSKNIIKLCEQSEFGAMHKKCANPEFRKNSAQ